jgi:hypothetical protein
MAFAPEPQAMMHTDRLAANRICPTCEKKLVPKPGHSEYETAKRTFCDVRCYRAQRRKHSPTSPLTLDRNPAFHPSR